MAAPVTDDMRDPHTPDDVDVRSAPREPVSDPTLGIPVTADAAGDPPHRLVALGDSLTHGMQSGAVFETDLAWPALVAHALGWEGLRRPTYGDEGGLPLNIEWLLRDLERRIGDDVDWWETPLALVHARQFMDRVEDYWERGPGSELPEADEVNHVLAVYGWDLRDALDRTARSYVADLATPQDDLLHQIVQNDTARAALRVLPTGARRDMTAFDAAASLGDERVGADAGVETLAVFLGSNNALRTVVDLHVEWSGDGYDDLERKRRFTVWRPSHFAAELSRVTERVRAVNARHVVWCTVPHVTVAPIARGVRAKVRSGSRYFPYYTRPWIGDDDFDPATDPHLTSQQARAVDSAIDQYNEHIEDVVRAARRGGLDWLLLDVAGLLDRLASRRYIEDPRARPEWWHPYALPPELAALDPPPDSRFLRVEDGRRVAGGLFSLDGVHPTTVAGGILAQELLAVMQAAGVRGREGTGQARVDFARLVRRDTLLTEPPATLGSGLALLGWADDCFDMLRRIFPS